VGGAGEGAAAREIDLKRFKWARCCGVSAAVAAGEVLPRIKGTGPQVGGRWSAMGEVGGEDRRERG
jgi:hypothetical protein